MLSLYSQTQSHIWLFCYDLKNFLRHTLGPRVKEVIPPKFSCHPILWYSGTEPLLRDHLHEGPPLFKDHFSENVPFVIPCKWTPELDHLCFRTTFPLIFYVGLERGVPLYVIASLSYRMCACQQILLLVLDGWILNILFSRKFLVFFNFCQIVGNVMLGVFVQAVWQSGLNV